MLLPLACGQEVPARDFAYHCEASKLKNGKAKFDNQIIDLIYDQAPPFNQIELVHYAQGLPQFQMMLSSQVLHLRWPEGEYWLNRELYLRELAELQKKMSAMLSTVFQEKILAGKLSIIMSPLSGDVSLALQHYWRKSAGNGTPAYRHGQLDFAFLPGKKLVQRQELLPFENLGLHAGEYFVQLERMTGFAVNIDTTVASAFLSHSLQCRNRLLLKEVTVPPLTPAGKEAEDNFHPAFFSRQDMLRPYFDLILEVLAHKTPYEKSLPVLKKVLKGSLLAKHLKIIKPQQSEDKKEWAFNLVRNYLQASPPDYLKDAGEAPLLELIRHFEETLLALVY